VAIIIGKERLYQSHRFLNLESILMADKVAMGRFGGRPYFLRSPKSWTLLEAVSHFALEKYPGSKILHHPPMNIENEII
jgi:hypothetical protein